MIKRRFAIGKLTSLADFIKHTRELPQVRKTEILPGDWVLVKTCNSVYTIRKLDDKRYLVSGGWFERHGLTPRITTVTGCSWGGNVIKTDIVAACGLCLEFQNRLITSPIRSIFCMPNWFGN